MIRRHWALIEDFLLVLVGGVAIRLAWFGEMNDYVKPSMRPWLLLAGCGLVVVAACSRMLEPDQPKGEHADHADHHDDHDGHEHHGHEHHGHEHHGHEHHGHDHHGGWSRLAVLLLAPAIVFLVVRPGPLTSASPVRDDVEFTAGREIDLSKVPDEAYVGNDAPDDVVRQRAVEVEINRFVRTMGSNPTALDGLAVRIVGQVADGHDGRPGIARMMLFCCAADALAVGLPIEGTLPEVGTWVAVSGRWVDDASGARLVASGVDVVPEPEVPYVF